MTSLSDTYGAGPLGAVWDRRQLLTAILLFATGTVMLLAGIVAATTDVLITNMGMNTWQSWEVAGVLAGIGIPSMIVGLFTILPSSGRQRLGAAIGLAIALGGVWLFFQNFPHQWHGDTPNHTLRVVIVYFTGLLLTLGYLFHAVANFKTRNDPGGTVNLQLSIEGETREVEVDRDQLGQSSAGGIGLLGSKTFDDVDTQTARKQNDKSD